MKNVTLIFDFWNHKELKDYLLSLDGVKFVDINDENNLIINIYYDETKIKPLILKYEICTFVESDIPSLLGFDYHEDLVANYVITIKNLCCEYCFKNMIDELLQTSGVLSAKSNNNIYDDRENVKIMIGCDPNKISFKDVKRMEDDFNK